jgi:putative addiction module killer protein
MYHKKRLTRVERVCFYRLSNGNVPFKKWFKKLDVRVRARIYRRLERIEYYGEFGSHRNLKGKAFFLELKFHLRGGYRVYCAKAAGVFVILMGGDKSSQKRDIPLARAYLEDFLSSAYMYAYEHEYRGEE